MIQLLVLLELLNKTLVKKFFDYKKANKLKCQQKFSVVASIDLPAISECQSGQFEVIQPTDFAPPISPIITDEDRPIKPYSIPPNGYNTGLLNFGIVSYLSGPNINVSIGFGFNIGTDTNVTSVFFTIVTIDNNTSFPLGCITLYSSSSGEKSVGGITSNFQMTAGENFYIVCGVGTDCTTETSIKLNITSFTCETTPITS